MKELQYTDLMGLNVKDKLKYCGEDVRLYQLAKFNVPECIEIDDHCIIFDYAFLSGRNSLKIGKYCVITWHSVIEGGGNIVIGNRVFLGPGCKLLSSTYELQGFYSSQLLPEDSYEIRYGDISIGDDAYIGANSVVMPGVRIGEGTVVGANSLVDHNLKPWGIYMGNPVKLIGMREKPTEERRKIVEAMDWTKHF